MKRFFIALTLITPMLISQATSAPPGLYFNISTTGSRANVVITLCLNGKGTLNCQHYLVGRSNLIIFSLIPDHSYPHAGIKLLTPGYSVTGCTPINNGYCLFSVSNHEPANIVISGVGTTVD